MMHRRLIASALPPLGWLILTAYYAVALAAVLALLVAMSQL